MVAYGHRRAAPPDGGEPPFRVRMVIASGTPTLALVGVLDAEGAPFLAATAADVITRRPAEVVVDCGELQLLTAAGVTALLDLHHRAWEAGVKVRLDGCSGLVRSVVALTGLDELLCEELLGDERVLGELVADDRSDGGP